MSKRMQKIESLLAGLHPTQMPSFLGALQAQMGHTGHASTSLYLQVPDSAPEGMSIAQAQFIWSRATELFTEAELIEMLAGTLQDASPMGQLYSGKVSSLDSQPSQPDAYGSAVFSVLRKLAATVTEFEIDDRGSCIVLNKSLWSHWTHHLLSILVTIGEAPESLQELLLQQDLGL
ncbi:hypothetical protein [Pseudomonas sp. NPDC089569]|uniref:hypothetical protein n=1 Tax=Pseudomonas sp. NPDC089569 TaxID=3390722 RepID=UPI003D046348